MTPTQPPQLTIEIARAKVINNINNSTKCCHQQYPNPHCTLHTSEYVEREAQQRMADAADGRQFRREFTKTLSEIVPKMSGRKAGAKLVEIGLRVYDDASESYRASKAALDEHYAQIVIEYGHPVLYWNIEKTMTAILNDDDVAQTRWREINAAKEAYTREIDRLDSIIDNYAYLSRAEQMCIVALDKGGQWDATRKIFRRAAIRAYYDLKEGRPLKTRLVKPVKQD